MKVFLARMAEPAERFMRQTNTAAFVHKVSQGRTVNIVSNNACFTISTE